MSKVSTRFGNLANLGDSTGSASLLFIIPSNRTEVRITSLVASFGPSQDNGVVSTTNELNGWCKLVVARGVVDVANNRNLSSIEFFNSVDLDPFNPTYIQGGVQIKEMLLSAIIHRAQTFVLTLDLVSSYLAASGGDSLLVSLVGPYNDGATPQQAANGAKTLHVGGFSIDQSLTRAMIAGQPIR